MINQPHRQFKFSLFSKQPRGPQRRAEGGANCKKTGKSSSSSTLPSPPPGNPAPPPPPGPHVFTLSPYKIQRKEG